MGWNFVVKKKDNTLTNELPVDSKFYFVHSYFVKVNQESDCLLKCNYGIEFDAAINKDNIFGAQFHPEKSHKYGMKLLSNFAKI